MLLLANYINGKWQNFPHHFPVFHPGNTATQNTALPAAPLAYVQTHFGEEQAITTAAIEAANNAFPAFSSLPNVKRADVLMAWYGLMQKHHTALANIISAEQGKPYNEASTEITYAAGFLRWFAEEARRVYGQIIPSEDGSQMTVIKQPIGVAAAITPWNFPAAMITRKVAPALAAGCTCLVKPAELTPISALALAALWQQALEQVFGNKAHNYAAAFNVLCGNAAPIGKQITSSNKVAKLSFTGSTAVGSLLAKNCAAEIKRYTLELGGNAPFLVFKSANIPQAVSACIASRYRNSGQTCVCANRIYVAEEIIDDFNAQLKKAVSSLKCAGSLQSQCQQGPLINAAAMQKVQRLVKQAQQLGGNVLCGGKEFTLSKAESTASEQQINNAFTKAIDEVFAGQQGAISSSQSSATHKNIPPAFSSQALQGGGYYQPTVITNVPAKADIHNEEIFGPVAVVSPFKSRAEAIFMANNTVYGLAAYFFSEDPAEIEDVSRQLKAGIVGVNTGAASAVVAPFGGVDKSGQGKEGGSLGIEEYLNKKYIKRVFF